MKDIVERLAKKKIIHKSFQKIDLKSLNSRKKIDLYLGIRVDNFYTIVIYINRKSQIVTKDIKDYFVLHKKLEEYNSSKILKKYIIIDSPLCNKAKEILLENGWKILTN